MSTPTPQIREDYYQPLMEGSLPMMECCCDPCYSPIIVNASPPNNYIRYGTTPTHPFWCYVDYRFCDWITLSCYSTLAGCQGGGSYVGGDWALTTYKSATDWATLTCRDAYNNIVQFPSGTSIYWKLRAYNFCGGVNRWSDPFACRKWTYEGDTGVDCNNCAPKLPGVVTVVFSNMTGSFNFFTTKSPMVCNYISYCKWELRGGVLGQYLPGRDRYVQVTVNAQGQWFVQALYSTSNTAKFACVGTWKSTIPPSLPCSAPGPLVTWYVGDLSWCSGGTTTQASITISL